LNDTSLCYPVNWNVIKQDILNEIKKFKSNIITNSNIVKEIFEFYNLKDSGVVIAKTKTFWILSDNGKLGAKDIAGHGHADNLMFLLSSKDGKNIFIDPGIGSYDKGFYRDIFRSTMMHNTLSIDKQNSSEVWSDFRVGKEAIPVQHNCKNYEDTVEIIGKVKWSSGEIHKRKIVIRKKSDSFRIVDQVKNTSNNQSIYVNFILHPNIKYETLNKNIILDGIIKMENNNYDYIAIEKVPYSENWGLFAVTHRLSFIKENYDENDKLEILIKKL